MDQADEKKIMDRLKQAIKEIYITGELIKSSKGGFLKRILTRHIAVRMHNLIVDQIFFQTNNTVNAGNIPFRNKIKDELVALRDLYSDFLQSQRHKFSGHFQQLPFNERIELWVKIDYTSANFFYEVPIEIYNKLHAIPTFEALPNLFAGFSASELNDIAATCVLHDYESKPNMSNDILSHTRQNSGGILAVHPLHSQCSSIAALEIIIDFELDLADKLKSNPEAFDTIKKVLITDLVNYFDNIFTRTDKAPGDPQYYLGLDDLLPAELIEAKAIYTEFKSKYKFQDKLNLLRNVRDKTCSHIDSNSALADLKILIDSVSIEEIASIYSTLKGFIEKVFRTNPMLIGFLIKNSEIRDAVSIQGFNVAPFSKEDVIKQIRVRVNYNDVNLYDSYLKQFQTDPSNPIPREFFAYAFNASDEVSDEREEIEFATGSFSYHNFKFTKAHKYLLDVLSDTNNDVSMKKAALLMLGQMGSSSPTRKILMDSYSLNVSNPDLQLLYVWAFGETTYKYDKAIAIILHKSALEKDLYIKYNSLLSLLKMDVSNRVDHYGKVNVNDSDDSKFIKQLSVSTGNYIHDLCIISALDSELCNNQRLLYKREKLTPLYHDFFVTAFSRIIDDLCVGIGIQTLSIDKKEKIIEYFNSYNYTVALGLMSEHLEDSDKKDVAILIYYFFTENLIHLNWSHETTVINYCLFAFRSGKKTEAIKILKKFVEQNPHKTEYRFQYFSLLKETNPALFLLEMAKFKNDYNLSLDEIAALDSI